MKQRFTRISKYDLIGRAGVRQVIFSATLIAMMITMVFLLLGGTGRGSCREPCVVRIECGLGKARLQAEVYLYKMGIARGS